MINPQQIWLQINDGPLPHLTRPSFLNNITVIVIIFAHLIRPVHHWVSRRSHPLIHGSLRSLESLAASKPHLFGSLILLRLLVMINQPEHVIDVVFCHVEWHVLLRGEHILIVFIVVLILFILLDFLANLYACNLRIPELLLLNNALSFGLRVI